MSGVELSNIRRLYVHYWTGNKKVNGNRLLYRRIQRTRPLLQEALFHLIITRGYERITIADA